MTALRSGPDHRLQEQLRFLHSFPAYTTAGPEEAPVLWYRGRAGAERLALRAAPDGVEVDGDADVARRVLNLSAPALPPPDALPARPPAHRWLRRRYGGIRPVLFAAPFEGIAWTVLGQQITVAFAARLKARLAERHGPAVPGGEAPGRVFPGPEDLAAAGADDLRRLQLSGRKAETLLLLARAIASGELDLEEAFRRPTPEAAEHLRRFPGVGRWTAEYVLLRVAGHPDVLPAGDAGLQRAWARLLGASGRCDEAALREAGLAWQGWRSDFAFYLWLDNRAARAAREGGP